MQTIEFAGPAYRFGRIDEANAVEFPVEWPIAQSLVEGQRIRLSTSIGPINGLIKNVGMPIPRGDELVCRVLVLLDEALPTGP